jgi:beta-lactamase regulating signal transducer with metallopeptidase domain
MKGAAAMTKLFLTILNMSITGAFVIAVICLARLPLKKAPKIISYCLWAVVAFRLLFPFSIESVLSLIPFKAAPIPQEITTQVIPRIESGATVMDNTESGSFPAQPETPAASVNPLKIWTSIGAYVWLIGVASMLAYGLMTFAILKRRMKSAAYVEGNIYEANNL